MDDCRRNLRTRIENITFIALKSYGIVRKRAAKLQEDPCSSGQGELIMELYGRVQQSYRETPVVVGKEN
jgi:hypothetical protein